MKSEMKEEEEIIEHKKKVVLSPDELEELVKERIEEKKQRFISLKKITSFFDKLSEFKPKKKEIQVRPEEMFSYLITPSYIEVKPDYARINEAYHRIVQSVGYPRKVEDAWLQSFLTKNEDYDVSIHISPSTINDTLVFLHNQIIKQTADLLSSTAKGTPNPALEVKLKDTKRLYDVLYKGEEKLFRTSLYIDNKERDLERLDLLTEKCKSNLNSLLIIPKTTNFRMVEGLHSTLPLGLDELGIQREFPTNSLAATFPFISTSTSSKKGILFAHEEETSNPIFIDFEAMSNKHFFVLGISGSGKSYTSKYLTIQTLFSEDSQVYILDPNAEYKDICESLGGENIEISRTSDTLINVFDLVRQDFGSKMLTLISVFDIITGGLSESQKGVLNKILPRVYELKGIYQGQPETWIKEPPTFSDVQADLENRLSKLVKKGKRQISSEAASMQVLLNRVSMYTKKGFFGFLDQQTKIDLKNKFINFDLSNLPHSVKPLMMFIVLDMISREIKKDKKPKVLLIDEGWALLRSKEAEDYLLDFIKTSRKYGASIGFITQELEDLLRSDTGRSILNMTPTKILMKQNTSNIDAISKYLKLNDNEKDFLIKCPKGHGLLITEKDRHKFFTKPSERIHELITTDPKEVTNLQKKKDLENVKTRKRKLKKEVTEDKTEKKGFNPYEGFFLKCSLKPEQIKVLEDEEYVEIKTNPFGAGLGPSYLVKPRHNESPVHIFFCKIIETEVKKYTEHVVLYTTIKPDVVVMLPKKTVCFEVETGANYVGKRSELDEKFNHVRKNYDDFYILVTQRDSKKHYEKYGKVIIRSQIKETIKRLFD